jgi:hypothetical protein
MYLSHLTFTRDISGGTGNRPGITFSKDGRLLEIEVKAKLLRALYAKSTKNTS